MSDRAAFAVIGVVTLLVVGLVGALMAGGSVARPAALDVTALPLLNACLNAVSAGFLVAGWIFIRRRRVAAHVTCMLAAFVVSSLFLVSYVTYHYHAGSRPFTGQGWIRPVYFALLITHIVLAAVIVPLALVTFFRGINGRVAEHRAIARWTMPLWLYVSITGVVVYVMISPYY